MTWSDLHWMELGRKPGVKAAFGLALGKPCRSGVADDGRKMLGHFWVGAEDGDIVIARAGVLRFVCLGEFANGPWYDGEAFGLTWGIRSERSNGRSLRKVFAYPFSPRTIYPLDAERAALFGV